MGIAFIFLAGGFAAVFRAGFFVVLAGFALLAAFRAGVFFFVGMVGGGLRFAL